MGPFDFTNRENEASIACKKGHVCIGKAIVKPSREVFGGEKLMIRKNQMQFTIVVIDIPKSRVGTKLVERYAKDITPEYVRRARTEIAMHQSNNRLETGERPSKKNRRKLMDFKESGEIGTDE